MQALDRSALPLAGATVVVTRASDRSDALVAPLEALGAHVVAYAATQTVLRSDAALRAALLTLADFGWVVFTSATSVEVTMACADACLVPRSEWHGTRIAVVGSSTAEAVRARGLEPTLLPDRFLAAGIVDAMRARTDVAGSRVLYPAAAGADETIVLGLSALGAQVVRLDIYETVATDDDRSSVLSLLRDRKIDVVTLSARSAVTAWCNAMQELACVADVVSIGPITSAAARDAGLRVAAEAVPSTNDGLVDAVVRAVRTQRQPTPLLSKIS
jgi:uroporphyrinogen-III synthase